jgi:hypothetical protein
MKPSYVYGAIFSLMITCFFVAFSALDAIVNNKPDSGLGIIGVGVIVFIGLTWAFGSFFSACEDLLKEANKPRNHNCTCGCSMDCNVSCTTCRADCACSCKVAGAQRPDASTTPHAQRDVTTPAANAAQTSCGCGGKCGGACGGNCGADCKCQGNGGTGSCSCKS